MSHRMESDAKERIRAAIDIVDLVGGFLPLRRQGRNYVALCPWHDDSRPSLQVNPDRQSWKCWVCGDGGDIFSFMMKHEGVEFREALEMLAERAGIELAERPRGTGPASPESDKKLLYQVMAWAEEVFHRELLQSPAAESARKYLAERSISADSIRRYRLGFAPLQWQWLVDRARAAGWTDLTLYALGLAGRSDKTGQSFDRFRGRLLFPIHDAQGRSIALGGRVIPGLTDGESAKYINSPETRLFTKSEQLYGLDIARDGIQRRREIIVMEGYTDVIVARQAGIDNVTAVLGTALGPNHIRLLRRFADRVVLVLDGDDAGQRRTQEILELFIAGQIDARIVTLPDALDPADFVLQSGPEPFWQLVDGAVDALEFKLRSAMRGIDPAVDTHRAHAALEDVLATVAKAPRMAPGATTESVRLREQQTLVRLARYFMIDETELRARLMALRQTRPTSLRYDREGGESTSRPASPAASPRMLDQWETELFELLIERPEFLSPVLEQIDPDELVSESARQLLAVYQDLDAHSLPLDFQHVMTRVESAELKRLLVQLDDRIHQRAKTDQEQRFHDLIAAYQRRRHDQACRQQLSVLEKEQLSETEQLDLLKNLIDSHRIRQGIATPTEG
ncbi:MAG: DNA primase [Pirellulales bacterium]